MRTIVLCDDKTKDREYLKEILEECDVVRIGMTVPGQYLYQM